MTKKTPVLVSMLMVSAVLAAACSPGGDPLQLETAAPTTRLLPSESTAMPPETPANTPQGATMTPAYDLPANMLGLPQVEQAKADLAGRLGVGVDEIVVVMVEAVTWPNGGLGCPQPGMVYAEVLVEGLFVQLEYAGQIYNYHSGGSELPFLCEQPQGSVKTTPGVPELGLTPPAPEN